MKFVHMADMHFDTPFTLLNEVRKIGIQRRIEQRDAFKRIIEYIKENNIEYLFISGDLYDNHYIRESTIIYINDLFKSIQNTKIFISPGNHDPYLKNSYYNTFNWNDNVNIFKDKIEIKVFEKEKILIYGYGFGDFECTNSGIENINIENINNINILITHANIDGKINDSYNPINKNNIKKMGFDYVALGHIHKPYYNEQEKQRVIYPGSTISLGFDELGDHGIISGEITKEKINIEFIKFDKKEFIEKELDISEITSEEELIEKINKLKIEENKYCKIILSGNKKINIDNYKIINYIENRNIIKINDKTKIEINIEEIKKQKNLKGYFLKEIEKNSTKYEQKVIEEAIKIVLDIMKA